VVSGSGGGGGGGGGNHCFCRLSRSHGPPTEHQGFTYDDATFQTQVQQATSYSLRPRGRCCCFGAPPTQPPTRPHATWLPHAYGLKLTENEE
jgi:hypothetical protein